jgi:hypothetical protein
VLNKLKLAAIFLIIPIICFFALGSALSDQERSWTEELRKQVPAERLSEFALPAMCSNPALLRSFDLSPACTPYSNTQTVRTLAASAAIGVTLFAGLIMLAGLVCKANRRLLLRVFRPGLFISNLVVSVLLLLQAVVLSGTYLYAVNDGKRDDNFYFYVSLFGVIALTGVFFTVKPLFSGVRKAQSLVVGSSLSRSDFPTLWSFIDHLAETTASDPPHNVKLVAFAGMWDGLIILMHDSLQKGTITVGDHQYDAEQFFVNASNVFANMVSNHADAKALEGLDSRKIPHPTDSHPPLSVRLTALRTSLPEIAPTALQVSPETPASSIIDHLEELECQLTAIQQSLLTPAQPGRIVSQSKSMPPAPAENGIQNCPSCGIRVLPTSNGKCPNCHTPIVLVREAAQ